MKEAQDRTGVRERKGPGNGLARFLSDMSVLYFNPARFHFPFRVLKKKQKKKMRKKCDQGPSSLLLRLRFCVILDDHFSCLFRHTVNSLE